MTLDQFKKNYRDDVESEKSESDIFIQKFEQRGQADSV